MSYSITKPRVVSILAKKKISIEKETCDSITEMPKSQLAELLNERIGPKPKLTAREVSQKGGIAPGYISELKSGAKDPLSLTLDAVLRLAKGLDESAVKIFLAAVGLLDKRRKGKVDSAEQVVHGLPLDEKAKASLILAIEQLRKSDMEFLVDQLRKVAQERLDGDT